MKLIRLHPRLLLAAGLGWIGLEFVLFWLCVQSIGVFPTLAFLTIKGGIGIILLATTLRGVFRTVVEGRFRQGVSHFGSALFVAAGALLVLLPGFLSTFAGLALFSPSARTSIFRMIRRGRRKSGRETIVALDPSEWRDVSAGKQKKRNSRSSAIVP